MGITHFSILNTHPNVEMVAVCDASGFILKNTARYIGVETFKEPGQMLDTMALDFVVVATPTAAHAQTVRMAIEKGLHVFVEKPFAMSAQEGQSILSLLQSNGKPIVNQVGYVLRSNDVFMQVRRLLENKVIGDLLSFKMEMYGPTVLHDAKSSWRSRKSDGGGCLYDFSSHSIDLINYLIGPPDDIVGTVFQSIHSAGVEDALCSTFLYESGARGNLLVNWSDPSYRKPTYRFEAFGRKGKIIADLHSYKLFLQSRCSVNGFSEGWNHRYLTDFFQPVQFYLRGYEFTRQFEHFVDCILKGTPRTACSFEDGHATDIVIERLRKDAENRWPEHGYDHLRRQSILRHQPHVRGESPGPDREVQGYQSHYPSH
jgi:predicted dehydrogenase